MMKRSISIFPPFFTPQNNGTTFSNIFSMFSILLSNLQSFLKKENISHNTNKRKDRICVVFLEILLLEIKRDQGF